ncbi:uncharacterized protein [Amphiura filiformis]|uniref:uncharacterized protein n=1 Tax=Amphiura filiformis TaxID=82378 RepID=UPI003B210012
MQQSQGQDCTSSNLNDLRMFHGQGRNYMTADEYNWNTKDEEEKESVDNVLDRSGLLDELVCQILDDDTAPAEQEKPTRTFMDVVNAKEFVPSCRTWHYGAGEILSAILLQIPEQMCSGKVINPPPGFEQIQNNNANDHPQVIPQNQDISKPPISDFERHITTLSSSMFPGFTNSKPKFRYELFQPTIPFETNSNYGDKPLSVSQGGTPTRFNFKAPPFIPSHSPLGWKGSDINPFKMPQQRSDSPVDQRPFNNMPADPPPTNRMLRGNFPMQPLPLPQGGKPFSAPHNIRQNLHNAQRNFLQKDPTTFYNSNSGRSSPFNFQNQQPTMGPYGDSFNNINRFNPNQNQLPNLKQQGFPTPRITGFPNKFPNGASTAFSLHQQHLLQQQLAAETPTSRLHLQLDECCIHVKRLEEERKKTEYELAQMHPGKRISSSNTIQAPQLPDNPSQVDRIIVDVYKEHSRLVTLMSKIEGLCTKSLHPNLEACLDAWMTSIQEAEVTQLADGIEKMKNATRSARTTLWCAFQMAKQDIKDKENK